MKLNEISQHEKCKNVMNYDTHDVYVFEEDYLLAIPYDYRWEIRVGTVSYWKLQEKCQKSVMEEAPEWFRQLYDEVNKEVYKRDVLKKIFMTKKEKEGYQIKSRL